MDYDAGKIRNVALFGHQGSGKTSLVESLYQTVNKGEKGTIEKGNTVSDYLKEEKARLSSIPTSIVPLLYQQFLQFTLLMSDSILSTFIRVKIFFRKVTLLPSLH